MKEPILTIFVFSFSHVESGELILTVSIGEETGGVSVAIIVM